VAKYSAVDGIKSKKAKVKCKDWFRAADGAFEALILCAEKRLDFELMM
jgi:hypothetical protein